jgi:Ca2+-binding EF-hand superfamily protein
MLDKSISEDTLRFVFDIFDVNKDGKIYRNQLGYVPAVYPSGMWPHP